MIDLHHLIVEQVIIEILLIGFISPLIIIDINHRQYFLNMVILVEVVLLVLYGPIELIFILTV